MTTISELVEEALSHLYEPYGENVTDEVLEVIEDNNRLRTQYDEILDSKGRKALNMGIGNTVRRLTNRETRGEHNCKRNSLAKTYTKLVITR